MKKPRSSTRFQLCWSIHAAQLIYEFPATLKLPQDLIDANKPDGKTGLIDQTLLDLITK